MQKGGVVKIGLFGVGHLGKIHLRCLLDLPSQFHLVGYHDPRPETDEELKTWAAEQGLDAERLPARFARVEDLLSAVDAVDIVAPTSEHAGLTEAALRRGLHCFIEKPVTATLEEGERLLSLQREGDAVVQVGHVERFNPAFQAAAAHLSAPRFIEAHRLAPFNPRGLDVPVVLDLMIHDIDLALHTIGSPVARVSAHGVAVVSSTPDIANARLEFECGAVANLTASRVSLSPMRKVRLFQQGAYVSVDLLNKSMQVVKIEDVPAEGEGAERDPFGLYLDVPGRPSRRLHIDTPEVKPNNAIGDELSGFYSAICGGAPCRVPLEEGLQALRVARQVMAAIEHSSQHIAS
jgi:predicted dehydrogenase